MNYLRKLPLSIAGTALGLAALGNLLGNYSQNIRYILGTISFVILAAVLIRILINFKLFLSEMKEPLAASIFPTLSMAVIILASYLAPFTYTAGRLIWLFGILLHLLLVIQFTVKFAAKGDIKTVYPSWFIVYVGVAVAAITAPVYDLIWVGQVSFWFGFAGFFLLLPVVLYRLHKVGEMPKPALANIAITCAPASLLLAGYSNSFPNGSLGMLYFLIGVAQLLYIYVLIQLPKLLKKKFLPSYSAFTFPFVISAMGLKLALVKLAGNGIQAVWLSRVMRIEEIIAVVFTLLVLYGFLKFIFTPEEKPEEASYEEKAKLQL